MHQPNDVRPRTIVQSFRHESRRSSTPLLDEIDLEALCHNVDLVRNHLGPDSHIIAALKGDAYGHGIGSFAKRLSLRLACPASPSAACATLTRFAKQASNSPS
ncbi:MAG TPA: hypothetical protein EYG46_09675 [Myxococcales bacterium]|nr:hypothetical protein [Myxococcales bacterium]